MSRPVPQCEPSLSVNGLESKESLIKVTWVLIFRLALNLYIGWVLLSTTATHVNTQYLCDLALCYLFRSYSYSSIYNPFQKKIQLFFYLAGSHLHYVLHFNVKRKGKSHGFLYK